jgi:hypothetical protein
MKIKAMVAGTTKIKRPASRLSRKFIKEGVMTYVPWLGLKGFEKGFEIVKLSIKAVNKLRRLQLSSLQS